MTLGLDLVDPIKFEVADDVADDVVDGDANVDYGAIIAVIKINFG